MNYSNKFNFEFDSDQLFNGFDHIDELKFSDSFVYAAQDVSNIKNSEYNLSNEEIKESDANESKETEIGSDRKATNKRFGRDQDRDMFDLLKRECRKEGKEVSEFWIDNEALKPSLQDILDQVYEGIGFKGNKSCLLKRIRKIGNNTKFSVRERKLLKKLLIQQVLEGKIDYKDLEYYFPGKTSEIIRNEVISMLSKI